MTVISPPRNPEWDDPTFDEVARRLTRHPDTAGHVIVHHGDPVTYWDGGDWTPDPRRARRYLGDATAHYLAEILQDGEVTVERIVP